MRSIASNTTSPHVSNSECGKEASGFTETLQKQDGRPYPDQRQDDREDRKSCSPESGSWNQVWIVARHSPRGQNDNMDY